MLKLLKNIKPKEIFGVLISTAFIVLQVWLDLKAPDYLNDIIRAIQMPGDNIPKIWEYGGYMLACSLGSGISSIVVAFFAAKISASFSTRIRLKLYNKVQGFSMNEINNFSTASLITRSTNDVTQIQRTVAIGLQVFIKAPILAIWAITKILSKSWQWSAITGGAVAIIIVLIVIVVFVVIPKFKKIQKLTDKLNDVTRENLTGLRVVKAHNAEKYEESKFAKVNNEISNNLLVAICLISVMPAVMGLLMSGLTLSIFYIGAYLINAAPLMEKITLYGNMFTFSQYAMQVIMAFIMLGLIIIMLPRANVSAKRINEVLLTNYSIKEGDFDKMTEKTGEVEFKNVSFKYQDAEEYILKDINFKANKGEVVAFIGSTGSGKSTLLNLIPRFYDVTEGEVLVDGVNVKNYKKDALCNKLGYVPQKSILFKGTIENNINFGDNGKDKQGIEEVKKAIEIAQSTDFVENMENNYQADIAQGGTNVSGGQKQRLSIARAICKKPEIFIFDDSFSALDFKTDKDLRLALKENMQATNLIVAQRIGTIINADKIIVLDKGNMVGMGTHKELLKNCKVYQEIAYSQLAKEELENA